MRIVQLIDSLEAGGAERMAVSYANALSKKIDYSGIVVTRVEGDLKEHLNDSCSYLFLKRNKIFDFEALFAFRKYLIKNKIDIVQAHSTSVFFAFLLKIFLPKIKIVWHDHYGNSELLKFRKSTVLKFISFFLFGVISVNNQLRNWAIEKLYCKKIIYLQNFTTKEGSTSIVETKLKGVDGKRILCLANLRSQKNHSFLIDIAEKTSKKYPNWSFHLVGKDFNDIYSDKIRGLIVSKKLEKSVFLYGSRNDISSIISQSSIGVLTSLSEGLPVSLLEYGMGKLPVVCTNVGEIASIIKNDINGFLVGSNDQIKFCNSLEILINNHETRNSLGEKLQYEICSVYAENPVMEKYLFWINEK